MDAVGGIFFDSGGINPNLPLGVLILFCRVGACLMLTPGFSSGQIPVQVRLFIALGVTLSLSPLLLDQPTLHSLSDNPVYMVRAISVESLIGASIGLLGRLFFLALETLAFTVATMLGIANPFGIEVEPNQILPPLASLITLSATALIFFSDLHWELLRGLTASYRVIPIGSEFNPQFALRHVADMLDASFRISLRVCSPFLIYAVVVNLAISVINRLTPQIAIFYVSTPFIIGGGLLLLYFVGKSLLGAFIMEYGTWLISG
jgi:flagellar biosynthetic protein FliR